MEEHKLSHQSMNSVNEIQSCSISCSCDEIIGPLLSSSSLPTSPLANTSTTSSPSNQETFINAQHVKLLMQESTKDISDEVSNGLVMGELVQKSDRSTALHVAASLGQSDDMLEFIVSKCSDLVFKPNNKGDLPVHVATRCGHLRVVEKLVELGDKQDDNSGLFLLFNKVNDEQNTCLHIALQNRQMEMSKMLFEKCPETSYLVNQNGFSPLYLAIKAEFWELVKDMVNATDSVDVNPAVELLKGVSVVHALIMAKKPEILKEIVTKFPVLVYSEHSIDDKGRRPLSYAANMGFLEEVQTILNAKHEKIITGEHIFQNEALKRDKDGCFPIHMACKGGNIQVVKELLHLSEKMRWLLNNEGRSILHVAAATGNAAVVQYLIKQPQLATMINMQDFEGYTPLHLAVQAKHPNVVYDLTRDSRINLKLLTKNGFTALDIVQQYVDVPSFNERLTWLALIYAGVPKPQQVPVPNIQPQTIDQEMINSGIRHLDIRLLNGNIPTTDFNVNHQQGFKHNFQPRKYKDRLNTLLIIATLVATVTYASGFTVPGSYNNDDPEKGMASLVHKHAFQVYVISNTIAMHSSILVIVILIWAYLDDLRITFKSLAYAVPLLGVALTMMSVAFMSGLYVVLYALLWLRLLVLIIGGLFLALLLLFFIPLFLLPMSYTKSYILSFALHLHFKLMLLASDKSDTHV